MLERLGGAVADHDALASVEASANG